MGRLFMRRFLITLSTVLTIFTSTLVSALATHPLEDIRATATAYVRANISSDDNTRISARKLDPRLKLALCKQKLQADMPYSSAKSSNTTVAVRCEGEQPWSLYVAVTIEIYRDIAVARRPLAQGTILSADDIKMISMDIARLGGGYLSEAKVAVGQKITRPVQLGSPILSNFLRAPTVIRRGQSITMLAKQSAFEVRSMGISMMDGAVGDRIKVRNRRSKRIIEGVVAKNGLVFVN